VIHLSCCKNLMAKFGEDEWEGPLFCGKHCFKYKKSLVRLLQAKQKEEYHGITMSTPRIIYMAVMIECLTTSSNYNQWCGGYKQNGAEKSVIANEICQIIKDNGITVDRPGRDLHNKINCF